MRHLNTNKKATSMVAFLFPALREPRLIKSGQMAASVLRRSRSVDQSTDLRYLACVFLRRRHASGFRLLVKDGMPNG